ncbi:MAG: LON peptidase substrate-binding domain-containing protein [Terriglobia bacterium]
MERRRVLQLLAATATSYWAERQLSASALPAPASGAGRAAIPVGRVALIAQQGPQSEPLLPLFPLQLVLFPHVNLPLHIFEPRYKEMIGDCLQNYWEFGILAVEGQSVRSIGCTASISEVLERFPDGRMNILVRGRRRFEVSDLNEEKSYLRGNAKFFDDDTPDPAPEDARQKVMELYNRLRERVDLENETFHEPRPTVSDSQLSFHLMAGLPADLIWKQELLELRSERERLAGVTRYLEQLLEHLENPGQSAPQRA